mgnify:CR=1 FL=1
MESEPTYAQHSETRFGTTRKDAPWEIDAFSISQTSYRWNLHPILKLSAASSSCYAARLRVRYAVVAISSVLLLMCMDPSETNKVTTQIERLDFFAMVLKAHSCNNQEEIVTS